MFPASKTDLNPTGSYQVNLF